jgi:ABC-2 type transport system ATP-binding protein
MLHITNLSKTYGRKKVIDNVTLNIPSTGIHVIRGENGSGKTTLLKCLAGLERHSGQTQWYSSSLKHHVAVAFDEAAVHDRLTGRENLSALVDKRASRIEGNPFIKLFLGADLLTKKSSSYSLGQRKKLKLAAAFANGRPCILLDEPASGLDRAGRNALRLSLESVADTICVVISDHENLLYQDLISSEFTIRLGKVDFKRDQKSESDE